VTARPASAPATTGLVLTPTAVPGAFLVEVRPVEDERGFFARTFDAEVFGEAGLDPAISQRSVSYNHRRGTLRGIHLQAEPHSEVKLVRCTAGAVWDVVVDLRPGSDTWGAWTGHELSARNRAALYVPAGCGHGFVTLEDDSELDYQISSPFVPDAATGVRWDDPDLAISWPLAPTVASDRDRELPSAAELRARLG
jgi:dTDP-4-dehydrorhamnose 3,5-epimerase